MAQVALSFLVPTVPSRKEVCAKLLYKLEKMSENYNDIEILCLYDNKSMSVGAKRQKLIDMAQGGYFQFVDDDDDIPDTYIDEVYPVIFQQQPDLITFNLHYTDDVGGDYIEDLSEDRLPNHTHCWRKDAIKHPYEDLSLAEDRIWVAQNHDVERVVYIPKVLYEYRYNSKTTETQG